MTKSSLSLVIVFFLMAVIPTAQGQNPGREAGEAAAQKWLPRAKDPIWSKLIQCKVSFDEKTGVSSIAVTPEVKALNGQTVSVRGFVLPMDGSDQTKHFLLARNTPICLFCPPGEPNEIVEVISDRAVNWTDTLVTVTGKMSLIDNGENALFFRIAATRVK